MLDRESTFADEKIVTMLKERFIPVAIDQWYTRRQQDSEGEFYRKIAGQGPRNDFTKTTQGLYIADASGKLIAFNNNRGPERIRKLMEDALKGYQAPDCEPIEEQSIDKRYDIQLPAGAVVVRSGTKVSGGYEATDDPWRMIFQRSVARNNLWILKPEIEALAENQVLETLALRIARYHLVDNTRGQPPVWDKLDVRELDLNLNNGKLTGKIRLETTDSSRGFIAEFHGTVEFTDEVLTRFDLVAQGEYWGTGQFTLEPPPGKFPLVVAFRLADGEDRADSIPAHGAGGWLDGYLDPNR